MIDERHSSALDAPTEVQGKALFPGVAAESASFLSLLDSSASMGAYV